MLFQLSDTSKDDVEKLLAFAKQNQIKLSLIDDGNSNLFLPGKPLTDEQLTQMIDKSRKSGMVPMQDAHQIIRKSYNAG
jgi:hypothetical protein